MKLKIVVLFIAFHSIVLSQPNISWIREYDSSSDDEKGISITETNDLDGYIICGYKNDLATVQDLFLIRTNLLGDTIWTRQYGVLNGSDYGMQILKTGDGYVIGGMLCDSSILYFDAWLLKINEDGDSLWSETLLDSARIKSICLTPDGGIAATGGRVFNGLNKLFIARFNPEGDLLWLNYYGNFYDSFGYDIICTKDSGFAVLGGVDSSATSMLKTWLLKTGENGNVELDTVYNIFISDGNLNQTYSGDYIVAVDMMGAVSFLKIKDNGETLTTLNLSDYQSLPEIIQTEDSNYICMYTTLFGSNGNCSIIFIKTDQSFNNIWTKEISGNNNYFGYRFINASNNSLLVTGWADPSNIQNENILLAKLEGDIIPVELVVFEGTIEGDNIILTWKTATENNNSGFDIERSSDKIKWCKIGFVKGNIVRTTPYTYSFVDSSSQTGIVYYRLKQIDLDGTFTYSNEISVEVNQPLKFSLEQNYPNPFNPVTRINYIIPDNGNVRLDIYNILGQRATTLVNENKTAGKYSIDFNAGKFASGIYFYQLTSGNRSITKKMMLLK